MIDLYVNLVVGWKSDFVPCTNGSCRSIRGINTEGFPSCYFTYKIKIKIWQLARVRETVQWAVIACVVWQKLAFRAVNQGAMNNVVYEGLGPANLVHCLANLYTLSNEYKVGVGANKTVKECTLKERGTMVKSKYWKMKKSWLSMKRIIAAGTDCHTAIRRIYEVHSINYKVSYILKAMAAHKANGGHVLRGCWWSDNDNIVQYTSSGCTTYSLVIMKKISEKCMCMCNYC